MATDAEGKCPQCRNWHTLVNSNMPTHQSRFGECSGSGKPPADMRLHSHSMDAYWQNLRNTLQHGKR
jgi:hypothetical protein